MFYCKFEKREAMNTKIAFNIIWLLGFGLIIFSAIYRSYNKDISNLIMQVGMGLTLIAIIIRLRFLKIQ